MKTNTSFVRIMRRLLVGVILLVLLVVMYDYVQKRRSRNGAVTEAPKILSSDMVRSVEGLTFEDYRDGVLNFKIHAQKLLEDDDGVSYLEGIQAYDFNPDGSSRNEIRSQNAVYNQKRKVVDFSGDVRLFLGGGVELRTNSLNYNLVANIGTTKDTLQFFAEEASGTAREVRFDQKRGLLDLGSEVDFVLIQENSFSGKEGELEKLHATSEKAHFSDMANRILFVGKAKIQSDSGDLTGDRIDITLDRDQKRVTSIVATGNAAYRFKSAGETRNLSGDRMVFDISESGALERIRISSQAAFSSASPSGELSLQGGEIMLGFDSKEGSISELRSRSNVLFRIKNELRQTLISGNRLQAAFNPETENVQNLHVFERATFSVKDSEESPGNELHADEIRMSFLEKDGDAVMEKLRARGSAQWRFALQQNDPTKGESWTLTAALVELFYSSEGDFLKSGNASGDVMISRNTDGSSSPVQVRQLHADYAQFGFFPETNQPRDMDAEGHVRVIYERKSGSVAEAADESFSTSSEKMHAVFELKEGSPVLKAMVQSGEFTYRDELRSAYAERCNYDALKELLVLEGSPKISDDMADTTGKRVEYDQKQKELSVLGDVRSKLGISKDKGSFLGSSSSSAPIIITAGEMHYRTEGEYARYETKVQLLSESQHLQAQRLEIFDSGDRVEAQGQILHLIANRSRESENSQDTPIKIRSEKFEYSREDKALAYSGSVRLDSGDLQLFSSSLDAILDDQEKNIERAVASGSANGSEHVFISQGALECTGDIAHWYLDPGKFVVIGDPAVANDPERGRSSAAQLTYFTADDRILLESRQSDINY